MSDPNSVVIGGRVTREPNVRTTPSGTSVCDIDVASNRYNTNKEQLTTFFRVTLWKRQAEWAGKNLGVGDTILVQGQLIDDNFEKEGQKTSGRLKVGNARLQLLCKKTVHENPERTNTEEPVEIPEV